MAGESQITASTSTAFAYTGSGYKNKKARTQTMAYASRRRRGRVSSSERGERKEYPERAKIGEYKNQKY